MEAMQEQSDRVLDPQTGEHATGIMSADEREVVRVRSRNRRHKVYYTGLIMYGFTVMVSDCNFNRIKMVEKGQQSTIMIGYCRVSVSILLDPLCWTFSVTKISQLKKPL